MRIIVLLSFLVSFEASSQVITGLFPSFAGHQVKLSGYNGFDRYVIDSAVVKENGIFQFNFSAKDYGIGLVSAKGINDFIVILAPDENLVLAGKVFPDGISITSGKQNLLLNNMPRNWQGENKQISALGNYLEKNLFSGFAFYISK
ncbi:MAG: hypothetical protein HC905_30650 [Bacteroidales bacterium]|nr:hypothetical protein [Bacteroidales bacterium]